MAVLFSGLQTLPFSGPQVSVPDSGKDQTSPGERWRPAVGTRAGQETRAQQRGPYSEFPVRTHPPEDIPNGRRRGLHHPGEKEVDDDRTRASLLEKVRQPRNDHKSWSEFVALYGPFLLRFLRRRSVRGEEALDLVQEVLLIVARKIGDFEYDPNRSFRAWLCTVASNQAKKLYRKEGRRSPAPGGTSHLEWIHELSDPSEGDGDAIEAEWRKNVLEQAMIQVRAKVKETTWKSFELCSLQNLEPAEAAKRLGISIGSVYTNVSRVLTGLRKAVEEIDESSS